MRSKDAVPIQWTHRVFHYITGTGELWNTASTLPWCHTESTSGNTKLVNILLLLLMHTYFINTNRK